MGISNTIKKCKGKVKGLNELKNKVLCQHRRGGKIAFKFKNQMMAPWTSGSETKAGIGGWGRATKRRIGRGTKGGSGDYK